MNNKYLEMEFSIDEEKSKNTFSLRQENDFFHDEDYLVHDLISVKRIKLPKGGENWDIIKNKKVELTLNGTRFSNKEKEFFRTAQGILFILNSYKEGLRTINSFKQRLKKCTK